MNKLVSIITPSYNSSKFIEDCIKSVISQTYLEWEMIIVDDCSTDESKSLIKKYSKKDKRIKTFFLEENVGAAEARNIAIRESKGKYIAFLDSDDEWKPQKLEEQIFFTNNSLTAQTDTLLQTNDSAIRTVTIIGVGDMMLGTNYPSTKHLAPNDGANLLDSVRAILIDADITFGNLEGTLAGTKGKVKRCRNPKLCYAFRSPSHYAKYYKDAGFDLVSIANNHSGDFGAEGREITMKTLEEYGIQYAGLLSCPTTIIEKDGIKYGLAAFAPNSGTVSINDIEGAKEIDRWHRERGWLKIGYGKVIRRNGEVEQGRGDDEVQAHVKGYNHCSYGLALVGGAKEENWKEEEDNFTGEQWESLKKVLEELLVKYPDAQIVGHRDLDESKFCPSFSVRTYLLNEDVKGYKFQDGLTDEADLQELEHNDND